MHAEYYVIIGLKYKRTRLPDTVLPIFEMNKIKLIENIFL